MLPPALEAYIYIYCILFIDGLRGISLPAESVESLTSMVHATEIGKPASGRRGMNQNPNSFLSLLMNNDTQQTIPSHTLQGPASAGNGSGMHRRLGPRGASSKRGSVEMQSKSMYTIYRDSACFTERSFTMSCGSVGFVPAMF